MRRLGSVKSLSRMAQASSQRTGLFNCSFVVLPPLKAQGQRLETTSWFGVPVLSSTAGRCLRALHDGREAGAGQSLPNTITTVSSTASTKAGGGAEFEPPEPRRFFVPVPYIPAMVTGGLGSLMRLGTGALVEGYSARLDSSPVPPDAEPEYAFTFGNTRLVETGKLGKRPAQPLQLYEFEACPFCRKVREALCVLDLDVIVYPCPKGGEIFRPRAIETGGKTQFPYLVDPNTGEAMYESDAIIHYLFDTYGSGKPPAMLTLGGLTTLTAGLASSLRAGKGARKVPSQIPAQPLELWSYEASPFCKIVRERLVELEVPYLLHNAARGSPKRTQLLREVGHFQVPYLKDPNTGAAMFESTAMLDYLNKTYAL